MPDWGSSLKREDLRECPFCDSVPYIQFKAAVVRISCVAPDCEVICQTKECRTAKEAESIWQFRPLEIREAAEREDGEQD